MGILVQRDIMPPGTNINIADVPGNKPSFVFNLYVGGHENLLVFITEIVRNIRVGKIAALSSFAS